MKSELEKLYTKYKEYIWYIIFGALTTLVSWASFYLSTHVFNFGVVPSNIISWVLSVAFAYFTNRKWVFESRACGLKNVALEALKFAGARVLTLVIETVFLWITVDEIGWNDMLMKIVISVVVLVLNYVFSKFMVFKGRGRE